MIFHVELAVIRTITCKVCCELCCVVALVDLYRRGGIERATLFYANIDGLTETGLYVINETIERTAVFNKLRFLA